MNKKSKLIVLSAVLATGVAIAYGAGWLGAFVPADLKTSVSKLLPGESSGPDLILVRLGGKYGYIDKTGQIVINPQFAYATEFDDKSGLARVGLVRGDGNAGFELMTQPGQVDNLNMVICDWVQGDADGVVGYIDKTGKFAINPQFEAAGLFDPASNLAPVATAGKYGYIDKTGKFAINPQFELALGFEQTSGLALVYIGGKWGYIDKTGRIVINPQFDYAEAFNAKSDLARVVMGGKVGFIDKAGAYVVNPQFEPDTKK